MEYFRQLDSREEYVEAIKEGEIVKVPESIALQDDLFILRKVVKAVPEVVENTNKKEIVNQNSYLEEWRAAKKVLKKNNVVADLVDNFHWIVSRNRRLKGFNRKQLGQAIGASEEEIKIIEMGELPKDDFILINKIENVLGIELRKVGVQKEVTLRDLQKMNEEKIRDSIKESHKSQMIGETKLSEEDFAGNDIEIID